LIEPLLDGKGLYLVAWHGCPSRRNVDGPPAHEVLARERREVTDLDATV
jgi:hypothetical protein